VSPAALAKTLRPAHEPHRQAFAALAVSLSSPDPNPANDEGATMAATATAPAPDTFFSDLSNTKPYLKGAFEGFAGSGKSYTMAALAIGLHQRIKSTKPIVAIDTEKALQWLAPLFADAGIRVLRRETRSMADLAEAMRRCREGMSDILLIDSISHIWEDVLASYMKKRGRTRLQFEDWGIIKPTWRREFSEPFVQDPYHCLMCGRAGYEYEDEKVTDEHGKVRREIFKSGVKMKVEGETAYEPDFLVLMERYENLLGDTKEVYREATVIKDRSTRIDGKTFRNPTYADFSPAIEILLANASWKRSESTDSGGLFESEEDRKAYAIEHTILLEKIEAEMTAAWPGQKAEEKKAKVEALAKHFGTRSWTEVTKKRNPELAAGLQALCDSLRVVVVPELDVGEDPGGLANGKPAAAVEAKPEPVIPPELKSMLDTIDALKTLDEALAFAPDLLKVTSTAPADVAKALRARLAEKRKALGEPQ
jgi:hypothetical protein